MADNTEGKEQETEKEDGFTGTPQEKLPDLEAENLDEKNEEQSGEKPRSGEEEAEEQ